MKKGTAEANCDSRSAAPQGIQNGFSGMRGSILKMEMKVTRSLLYSDKQCR